MCQWKIEPLDVTMLENNQTTTVLWVVVVVEGEVVVVGTRALYLGR
jgi:hypothetical protein